LQLCPNGSEAADDPRVERDAIHGIKPIYLEFAEGLKKSLGEEVLVFSVDTKAGKVAVKGWRDSVDLTLEEASPETVSALKRDNLVLGWFRQSS
jgi:phosphoribosylformimino-5-aminoimidazole carboxamide ribonucleotide (ProFAR) isomerase